ncbi:MAG TPA: UvrD-helicase domain-containing protein, partial [Paracoccaceae bacterium]|nr:UvrD-helicase domain-containing protein [Paracoccaceae bacterium]
TEFAAALAIGGAHDQATSAALQSARNQPASTALELLFSVFLTAKGELRKTTTFPTKAVKTKFPWAEDLTITLMERVFAAKSEQAAVRVLAKTEALHRFATKFLSRYKQAKSAIGRLDFDDQIQIARGLLTQSDMAQWVLFRLDGGIDHILVDEAQDTSPDQWEIVRALASEFTAGKGQSDADRTIFVVGDEKQSIYSFQGADPQAFDAMRNLFGERLRDSGAELQKTGLLYSFRSARPILEFVDRVFQGDAAVGVAMDIQHRPFHSDQPGRVDLWPMIEPSGEADSKPWFEPVDAPEPGAPKIRLAKAIAAEIQRMLKSGTMLPTRKGPRPVRAGDILILVQGRQEIFHSIIKELKALQVPVAGADRENITDSLAVQDLLALLQFMATPEDDLSLAAVLRSPLFGITESELFGLAHGRERTLWSALQSHEARFPDAVKMLKDLLSRDEFLRPFEILDRVLTVH